jgi:hypothetical protein
MYSSVVVVGSVVVVVEVVMVVVGEEEGVAIMRLLKDCFVGEDDGRTRLLRAEYIWGIMILSLPSTSCWAFGRWIWLLGASF